MKRGAFGFEVTDDGNLIDSAGNVELLRGLWLDRTLVQGNQIGPGDPGDFNFGAWHSSCHLVGAGGVRKTKNGGLLWLEISHDVTREKYYASVTQKVGERIKTSPLNSADGRSAIQESKIMGFVEGNSLGRTSARGVNDSPTMFNLWRRQDVDQPIDSKQDGGKVWEHWCTLRDIRQDARIGTSMLTAYVSLVSALGDRFAATVARGRRDYGHPVQLCAMVKAGLISEKSAFWEITPKPIPENVEALFYEADPVSCFMGAERLDWSDDGSYYMFPRMIKRWSSAENVRKDLVTPS